MNTTSGARFASRPPGAWPELLARGWPAGGVVADAAGPGVGRCKAPR